MNIIKIELLKISTSDWFAAFKSECENSRQEAFEVMAMPGYVAWIEEVLEECFDGFPLDKSLIELQDLFEANAFDYEPDNDTPENREALQKFVIRMFAGVMMDHAMGKYNQVPAAGDNRQQLMNSIAQNNNEKGD